MLPLLLHDLWLRLFVTPLTVRANCRCLEMTRHHGRRPWLDTRRADSPHAGHCDRRDGNRWNRSNRFCSARGLRHRCLGLHSFRLCSHRLRLGLASSFLERLGCGVADELHRSFQDIFLRLHCSSSRRRRLLRGCLGGERCGGRLRVYLFDGLAFVPSLHAEGACAAAKESEYGAFEPVNDDVGGLERR